MLEEQLLQSLVPEHITSTFDFRPVHIPHNLVYFFYVAVQETSRTASELMLVIFWVRLNRPSPGFFRFVMFVRCQLDERFFAQRDSVFGKPGHNIIMGADKTQPFLLFIFGKKLAHSHDSSFRIALCHPSQSLRQNLMTKANPNRRNMIFVCVCTHFFNDETF